jgi:type IV secretory pathway protease TraF
LVKSLAAGPGDHVCTTDGLTINGKWIAPVFDDAGDGVPLPRWRECRVLTTGEWFAYAPRIPNSLDGRYYGPVREADIIGVYLPVWTD